jgi:hypothetical protein
VQEKEADGGEESKLETSLAMPEEPYYETGSVQRFSGLYRRDMYYCVMGLLSLPHRQFLVRCFFGWYINYRRNFLSIQRLRLALVTLHALTGLTERKYLCRHEGS